MNNITDASLTKDQKAISISELVDEDKEELPDKNFFKLFIKLLKKQPEEYAGVQRIYYMRISSIKTESNLIQHSQLKIQWKLSIIEGVRQKKKFQS